MKIAVLSLTVGDEYKKITKYGRLTKLQYCQRHGYDFIDEESIVDSTRPLSWSKIPLILKYLPRYDYVVWIDGDTYIMNPEITLESLIDEWMEGKDMMMASDHVCLNAGVMFIKNTAFSKEFFEKTYTMEEYIYTGNWEQDAIIKLYETNTFDSQNKIKIVRFPQQIAFNSYYYNFKYGQFIIHMAGCQRNLETLQLAMNDYCPLQKDGESDQSYENRQQWIKTTGSNRG